MMGSDFHEVDLSQANLEGTDLSRVDLEGVNFREANLHKAFLRGADLHEVDLREANLREADLREVDLREADLSGADLRGADLRDAFLRGADLSGADFSGADLRAADLGEANLRRVNLSRANLSRVCLETAILVETDLEGANLSDCRVYGISAWNINVSGTQQSDLVITPEHEPMITVDNLEVAQFIYLLLHNEKIREVIDTIGKKGVLILGRFAGERKAVLDALRTALRQRNFLPIVFDFEKPTQRDFTETIMILAGMSLFVIADITNPRSAPLELQATVLDYMIPFVPIIAEGEPPFSMFRDLQIKHDWVLDVLTYDTIDHLVAGLQDAVIAPALQKHEELVQQRARAVGTRHIQQYLPPGDAHP
jgi:Pentapeptide repeats (8 copies)